MKKIVLTLSVLSGFTIAVKAQYARFGLKAGALLTTANRDHVGLSDLKNKVAPGVYAGGFMEISFKKMSDRLKIQVEADYSNMTIRHSFQTGGTVVDEKSVAHILSVPVLIKYFFTPSLSLYAGPTGNLNLASKALVEIDGDTRYSKNTGEEVSKFLMGGMFGVNYYISKGFFLEARYYSQFPDYYRPGFFMPSYRTIHNFQLGLGYKF